MKRIPCCFGAVLTLCLLGCTSKPLTLGPVGPNPASLVGTTATGQLEVFSATETERDGNEYDINPAWHQHSDYTVYSLRGQRVRHVFNSVGHYAEAPRVISLPAGKYLVKAHAKGDLDIAVPVLIERGRTTKVHLDDNWHLPPQTPKSEIVSIPYGYPVGWRSDLSTDLGTH